MTEAEFLREARAFYDALAVDYADRYRDYLAARPLDRAVLAGFAELVRDAGPVADVGCGPGWTTAHLAELGVDVFGLDLSPEMVGLARQAYPALRFDVGSMLALDLPDGTLGGLNAWYSIIHLPEEQLPAAFAEFHRVLKPGGHLQLAFQVGDEPLHLAQPYGHPVSLDFRRLRPERIAELLAAAGLLVQARLVREPDDGERTQQAFLLARKPLADS
ncbi:class I SAM-dependent methyltransferase [Streptomyces sp. UNOC14_S4]|uniref:class I SAM-dependent methyltransferase n=1 Tax=Streptomyces sp. UNOC14_S4 TaxID=2872340 RepID=UPI001E505F15|nr:class I SAM-dependent methyltransferase [Streptomyces sp. UNOC14_S4]MCC3766639.1 class I SAM-dependent methyltransferase [Streptomyces sp. UNOC14_S4]